MEEEVEVRSGARAVRSESLRVEKRVSREPGRKDIPERTE